MNVARYRIVHNTEYRFSKTTSGCTLIARLRPRETHRQQRIHFQMVTNPLSELTPGKIDMFGNHLDHITVCGRFQRLVISANSTVHVCAEKAAAELPDDAMERQYFQQPTTLVPLSQEIKAYGLQFADHHPYPLRVAQAITQRIYEDFTYYPSSTNVGTSADEVLRLHGGVCQDFAHLSVALLRSLGIFVRYVSGYVYTAATRGKNHRIAADASHAWFEVCDRDVGWVGFDPTHGRQVDENYIVVAWGRDYSDACPLSGIFDSNAAHTLHVSVDVQRLSPL